MLYASDNIVSMDTAKYQKMLEEELAQLTVSLKELGVQNPDVKEDWIEKAEEENIPEADPNDVADRTEEYNIRTAELGELEKRWNNVRLALNKIKDGTYGICEISGEQIEEDRLEANPAARTCKAHLNEETI